MKRSKKTVIFKSDIQKVWTAITDNTNYAWRSDLTRIEIIEPNRHFVEYSKNGVKTDFFITAKEPFGFYEFNLSNRNLKGRWQGTFKRTGQGTEAEFLEEVNVTMPLMNLLAGFYLKKRQKQYIEDLKKALGEQ